MRTQAMASSPTLAFVGGLLATNARASYHTFVIDEVFTAADGGVQYVVLREAQNSNGENLLAGRQLVAKHGTDSRSFTFPANLPSSATAGKRVLIGSVSYAALGLVAPDYIVPDRFVPTDGGSLNYADADTLALPALPTDGTLAFFAAARPGPNVATNFAGASAAVPPAPVTVVEYYHAAFDHYFVTSLAPEIAALDSGRSPAGRAPGAAFAVLSDARPRGTASPVCRFYIPPQHGDSHFFSASPAECADDPRQDRRRSQLQRLRRGDAERVLHRAARHRRPARARRARAPVYRLWNQRADSNHRYTTERGIKAYMQSKGYVAEGYGPDAVAHVHARRGAGRRARPRTSGFSPFAPSCDGVPATGTVYANAEVEPYDRRQSARIRTTSIGVWQQDRWSNGGARGLGTAYSFDGGGTWTRTRAPFSRCTGGNAANGGNFERASDPWVTFAPDGTAYQIALALQARRANGDNAILVTRSTDGGRTWSNAGRRCVADDAQRLQRQGVDHRRSAPTRATSTRCGTGWPATTAARRGSRAPPTAAPRGKPRATSTTRARTARRINNQIVVLPDGTLVLFFTELATVGNRRRAAARHALADKGATWSAPITIADVQTRRHRRPGDGHGHPRRLAHRRHRRRPRTACSS